MECKNVIDMSYLFVECESVLELIFPNWIQVFEKCKKYELFEDCESLIDLPDLSKWNTKNLNKI